LVLFSRIALSFAIFIIAKRIGTATIPLMTAVYINGLIGSIPLKLMNRPIAVEAAITI